MPNVIQYAKRSGHWVRRSWYDWPNGNLNLNLILGIAALFELDPNVCTCTQYLDMERIRTLVLLVVESSLLKFSWIMHLSPTHNKRLCGGIDVLLKVFKAFGTNIFFSMSYGSSTSANMSPERQYCRFPCILKDGFKHWMMLFHSSTCVFLHAKIALLVKFSVLNSFGYIYCKPSFCSVIHFTFGTKMFCVPRSRFSDS